MHRFTATFLLLTCLTSQIMAQTTISNSYFLAANDSLKTAFALPQFLAGVQVSAGSNTAQTWDYSYLRSALNSTAFQTERYLAASSDTSVIREFPTADVVRELSPGRFAVYNVTSTRFELIGYNKINLGPTLNIPVYARFLQPALERRAPLSMNSTNKNNSSFVVSFPSSLIPDTILSLLPIRPDSIRIRYQTTRNDLVDAFGTIAIPGLSKSVLREKRYEETEFKLEAKLNPLPWLDITNLILQNGMQRPRDTTIRYYFWSEAVKEPIAVISTNVSGKVESVEYKYVVINTSTLETGYTEGVAQLTLSPNPTQDLLTIDIADAEKGSYQLSIYDVTGRLWHTEKKDLSLSLEKWQISLNDLPSGSYWVQLKNSKGQFVSEQCIKK